MTVLFSFRAVLLGLLTLGCLAHAQVLSTVDSPSAAQMIEQLKAPAASAPRTRSLRNLGVEATDAQGAVASRPSLSLHIQFDFDSARVRPESQQALSNLALALQSPELLLAKFAIEGHTDAKGRADYNHKLSALRADAVRDYLAQQGVETRRLIASGKGSSELANRTEPYAAENRRVRIVNLE
jgi:outer membrane protein OmpA-like peptidoglycan-associated protein